MLKHDPVLVRFCIIILFMLNLRNYIWLIQKKFWLYSAKNVVFSIFCLLVGWPMVEAITPLHPGYATVFDPSTQKNVITYKFFNLINAIQINSIKALLSSCFNNAFI